MGLRTEGDHHTQMLNTVTSGAGHCDCFTVVWWCCAWVCCLGQEVLDSVAVGIFLPGCRDRTQFAGR